VYWQRAAVMTCAKDVGMAGISYHDRSQKNEQWASVAEDAELIKWWDAVDLLTAEIKGRPVDVEKFLRAARDCRHPDAQWLTSLFPATSTVTQSGMRDVLLEQGDDPRAIFFVHLLDLSSFPDLAPLMRAAEMGYAPAQAAVSGSLSGDDAYRWALAAAAQGHRTGFCLLGRYCERGVGCDKDETRAAEMFRKAATLGDAESQWRYGEVFEKRDWQRYHWQKLAATRVGYYAFRIRGKIATLLPSFERGELCRVLHTVGPCASSKGPFSDYLEQLRLRGFGFKTPAGDITERMERISALYRAMMSRARVAIACWSVAGLRLRLVKDMRVMIAKMAWEEAWRWGETAL
jgi:hypothetical protein